MDITPDVNLLYSQRGDRIDYVRLIGEGVDNAFDAEADAVVVNYNDREIQFVDNGRGVLPENIPALFALGRHGPQATTALGRFGVGITSQAINAGDEFSVASTSARGRFAAEANWRKVLSDGQWRIADPRFMDVPKNTRTGTKITIGKLRRPPKVAQERIIDDLALRFYPGLAIGRSIKVNGQAVPVLAEPMLTNVVDRQINLSDGRVAHLRAGMLTGPSPLCMVHVGFRHRVILPECRLGCGTHSGLSKMFARIQLTGPWHLAKFKDDLTDEAERDELEAAVLPLLLPILEECSSASLNVRITELTSRINDMIPEELKPARPNAGDRTKSGNPEKSARKSNGHVAADKSEDADSGPARAPRKPKDQLIINLDGRNADQGIGKFIAGRPHCVNLSPDNGYISSLVNQRDQDVAVKSLVYAGLSIFMSERNGGQLAIEPFGTLMGQLMALQSPKIKKKKK